MKTYQKNFSTKTKLQDVQSNSIRDIARQIAVLVVRRHRMNRCSGKNDE